MRAKQGSSTSTSKTSDRTHAISSTSSSFDRCPVSHPACVSPASPSIRARTSSALAPPGAR
eukprot:scaffold38055_cov34-Prasinocladus_malaysianus.AAC.1